MVSHPDFQLVNRELDLQQQQLAGKVQLLSGKATAFFAKNGFTKEHFNRGAFYKHFTESLLQEDAKKWIPSAALLRYIANNEWYAQSKSDDIKQLVDLYIKDLQLFMDDLFTLLKPFFTNKAVLQNIYSIAESFPIDKEDTYPLTGNCRNTTEIHNLAYKFYKCYWRDIISSENWEDLYSIKKSKPAICITMGWLISTKNNNFVFVADVSFNDDETISL